MLSLSSHSPLSLIHFFFFPATSTPLIYPLSLHDALPISGASDEHRRSRFLPRRERAQVQYLAAADGDFSAGRGLRQRSEEHTSELQSLTNLVCRLLLEKKKKNRKNLNNTKNRRHTNQDED